MNFTPLLLASSKRCFTGVPFDARFYTLAQTQVFEVIHASVQSASFLQKQTGILSSIHAPCSQECSIGKLPPEANWNEATGGWKSLRLKRSPRQEFAGRF
jgi:hypothetical protein